MRASTARRVTIRRLRLWLTALPMALAFSGSHVSSQAPQTIGDYELVSEVQQSKTISLFTYRAILTNSGGALSAATATARSRSPHVKIVDGSLTFGPVGSPAAVLSSDTFAFTRHVKGKFDFADIVWTISATPNRWPVANAGPDATRLVGQTAQLDGSASSDLDGNPLTYHWSFVSIPAGSLATLSDATAVKPTLVVDQPGNYVVQLVVNDGFVASAPDTVTVTTLNSAPVANAGPDQTAFLQQPVTLNGGSSSDVDGNALTFSWHFVSRPAGSASVLSNPTAVMPVFVVDTSGTYVVQLVVNDGFVASAPDTVSITTLNSQPVANAGADQTVFVTNTATLDASGSTDVDGDPITYGWALISAPAGSAAALDDSSAVRPTFRVDKPGMYVAQLVVHDGAVSSAPDTVTLTTQNTGPVANAGADQTILAGQLALLDGTASSDVDADPLAFTWSFTSVPAGSTAVLAGANSAGPSFVLDRTGTYVVQLIVNDGSADSAPDTVAITTTNSAPAANAGPDVLDALVGSSVTLDGTQSIDPDGHPLTYSWSLLSQPEALNAALAGATTALATLPLDAPGDYVGQLIVNDGFVDSAPDTVLIHAVPLPVITVTALDPNAAEPFLDPAVIRLERDTTSRPVAVSYTIGGTATNGVDYQMLTGTAFFAPGQSFVDVPIAPLDDSFAEGPETVTITLAAGADYALGNATTAAVTIADEPPITLALLNASVVGVAIPTALQVTLGAVAPPGGVTVTVTSDDPNRLAVEPPGTTTIPQGQAVGQVMLDGLTPGGVTVRANTVNYQEGTLAVTVVRNIISVPATFNVPLGQSTDLPITIVRDAGNNGAVLVSVASDNPAAITVTTPTVTIPAGQLSVNATVFGQGVGSATLTASAANFASDSGVGTTTATLDITIGTLTINTVMSGAITIELESPPGSPIAAPQGGLVVNLAATDSTCVSVPATVTIAQGATSTTANVSYGGTASVPCSATVTATGPAGFAQDMVTVSVNSAPGITLPSPLSVAGGLQAGNFLGTLAVSQHGGVTVRLESSDASRILVAPNATTPGSAAIDIDVPNGLTGFNFHVQATDWIPGTSTAAAVTLTATASGFTGEAATVSYVQPALRLAFLPATITAAAPNEDFIVQVGVPTSGNASVSTQARRAGAGNLTVTVTNSNANAAEIDPNGGGNGLQSQTAAIAPGQSGTPNDTAGGLEFDPKAAGTTTVTATIPGFITTAAGAQEVTVTSSPAIALGASLGAIGGGLQAGAFSGSLGAAPPGGVTVHLESSDPSRVRLAPNRTTPGSASIDIAVPNGQLGFVYYIEGADWVEPASTAAEVTITASAVGFIDGTTKVDYVQPAVDLSGVPSTTSSLSASTPFLVRVGVPSAGNTVVAPQERRPATAQEQQAGTVPNLNATVTTSAPLIGQIAKIVDDQGNVTVDQSQTATIAVGLSTTPSGIGGLKFDPVNAGETTVTVTIPGFISTAGAAKTVTVNASAGITINASLGQLGGGLQLGAFSGSLGASEHNGVTVHLGSSDPSRVLLAKNSTTAGASSLDFDLPNGQTSFTYYVQGTDWLVGSSSAAAVTLTASATGFTNGTGTVNYVQPALDLAFLPATTTVLSANSFFSVRVGVSTNGNASVTAVQQRRPATLQEQQSGIDSNLTATVANSQAAVAEIDRWGGLNGAQVQTTVIASGQSGSPTSGTNALEFDPLSTGQTTVTATIPGFITTTAGAKTVTVTAATMTLPSSLGSVGGGLQNGSFVGTLGGSQHGGVTVHVASSDPSRVLLAPNATTPGSAAIDIVVANGQTSFAFHVQGTDWVAGSSTAATVTVTSSAPGFTTASSTVNYLQPAVDIAFLQLTTTASAANNDFQVRVGIPASNTSALTSVMARRAGAPPLTVTVTNSQASVAEIDLNNGLNGAQIQTATIAAGQSATPFNASGGLEFDPLTAGQTTVTATIAGFITTTAGAKTVTVNP